MEALLPADTRFVRRVPWQLAAAHEASASLPGSGLKPLRSQSSKEANRPAGESPAGRIDAYRNLKHWGVPQIMAQTYPGGQGFTSQASNVDIASLPSGSERVSISSRTCV